MKLKSRALEFNILLRKRFSHYKFYHFHLKIIIIFYRFHHVKFSFYFNLFRFNTIRE
ncbi:hypothetical protein C1646_685681 [Rhizophagus diaphanus]|nr:hypothetical protein C1646_685681 [Rhizophagus diaphanus] [Rhizophagus sp. MUCL 43196]